MLSFLLWVAGYLGLYLTPWPIFIVTGLLDGLLFWPVVTLVGVPYMGRITREKVARLWYLLAVAPVEGILLLLVPNGYRFALIDRGAAYLGVDDYVSLDETDCTWYKLGNRKFGIEWLRDEQVLGEYRVNEDEFDVVAQTDGGERAVLDTKRGGLRGYTKYADGVREGTLGSLTRAVNALRGGGGVRLSERTETHTLKNYGGATHMSNKIRLIGAMSAMGLGVVTGVLVFGVL